jgi:protein gp37
MSKTKVSWSKEGLNPVTGCTKLSEGCQHCYAERLHLPHQIGFDYANHY